MPEGDTVYRTARQLDAALSGRPLMVCDVRVPAYATVDLVGQTVDETVSRGKHLLTRVGGTTIHTHLKMEGSWHLYRPGSRWRSPAFQARLVLANGDWQAVGFRLGLVEVIDRAAEPSVIGHLGPDLLGPDWSLDEAVARISSRPDRQIGVALLNQRNLSGIGNMYMAEVCFLHGIHPASPVGQIATVPRVIETARRLLLANIDRPEQSTTGDLRRGATHWVYNRAAQSCRRCRTPIRSGVLSGDRAEQARTCFWCPSCQPVASR